MRVHVTYNSLVFRIVLIYFLALILLETFVYTHTEDLIDVVVSFLYIKRHLTSFNAL